MEREKKGETLKTSQNEIFRSKVREDGNPGCFSNVIEKCVVDVYSGRNELSNYELSREFGYRNIEESMVVDGIAGDNRVSEGAVNDHLDQKLRSTLLNNDFPVLEGGLKFNGNDEDHNVMVEEAVRKFNDILHVHEFVSNEKIVEPMEKGNNVLHPHEPGSPTKIDVSGNSINLFVEVFGPSDGISGTDDTLDQRVECELGENNFKQELSLEENGTTSTDIKDLSAKNEGEDIVGEQECTFDNGDLVWVKTRTQLWWPGMVCYPSSAPNDMTKCEKRGTYLVKYYGNASYVWCENADLKPFSEYFEQMSKQNNSRNFYGSVDRALCEIGHRVKLKMTCPCFAKDGEILDAHLPLRKKEESSKSMLKASKYDALSLSQFQPAAFLADIKDLARSMQVPGKVKLMVMKNRLLPFYRATGHRELPLQLLKSGSDATQNAQEHPTSGARDESCTDHISSVEAHDGNVSKMKRKRKMKNNSDGSDNVLDDKITSSSKGLESRERKKSKYLSYPYVDVKKGQENDDLEQSPKLEGSCSGMDLSKSGTKKPFKGRHIISKGDDINASSVELLAELCSSARDCFYISRSKYSDSLKRFYCSFRMFAFPDADIASKVDGDQPVLNLEKCVQGSAEAEPQAEESKVVKKPRKQKASVKKSVDDNVVSEESAVSGNQNAEEKSTGRRGRKKGSKNPQVKLEGSGVMKESENQGVNLAPSGSESAAKIPSAENPQAKENSVCWKINKEKEEVAPPGLESIQSSSNMGANTCPPIAGLESVQNPFSIGANIFPTSSWMISFQQACAGLFISSKTPQKSVESTPGVADTNSISRLPDLNGNLPFFPFDHMPAGEPSINLVNTSPEQKKHEVVTPTVNGVHQMDFSFSSTSTKVVSPTVNGVHQMDFSFSSTSTKDAPVTAQNTPLSNNGATGPCIGMKGENTPLSNNGATSPYIGMKGDSTARRMDPITMNTGISPFSQQSFQMASFLSACKPLPKRRKMKEKTCEVASGIPDLNGNEVDMNLMSPPGIPIPEGIHIPPEDEPQKKRRYRSSAGGEPVAPLGGNLLLKFSPGCVPPRETLVATFSRFGLLKESELEVSADDCVKIPYERSSDARFAYRSLEKSHAFGESLLGFTLDGCSMPDPPKIKKKTNNNKNSSNNNLLLHSFVPCRNQSKAGETPDIAFIKQNVEMMKSTLEKAGDSLSPETRAKLEKEIKAFLAKISSVTGSSS